MNRFLITLLIFFPLHLFSQTNQGAAPVESVPAQGDEPSIYQNLVWSDEFNGIGAINTAKWHHQTQLPNGSSWFNGELQHYTDRTVNSYLEEGYLHIKAQEENFVSQGVLKEYTSARLNSKFAFTYGRVEVRAKLPEGDGTWPAIWMLGKNINETGAYFAEEFGEVSWPACGEIDIMEHWGVNPNYVSSAIHTPSSFGGTVNVGGTTLADVFNTFHIYEMEWTPEKIVFSVDGVVHYTYEPTVQNADTWPFDEDQYLLLNVAINGDISTDFSSSEMVVDYVRVYQEGPATPVYNVSSTTYSNGVVLSWDPPAGAAACEIKGGPQGGSDNARVLVANSNPSSVFINAGALGSGGIFQWRVRCATNVNPVEGLTGFSEYDVFTFPPAQGAMPAPLNLPEYHIKAW